MRKDINDYFLANFPYRMEEWEDNIFFLISTSVGVTKFKNITINIIKKNKIKIGDIKFMSLSPKGWPI
jgi:hypothetical protein